MPKKKRMSIKWDSCGCGCGGKSVKIKSFYYWMRTDAGLFYLHTGHPISSDRQLLSEHSSLAALNKAVREHVAPRIEGRLNEPEEIGSLLD